MSILSREKIENICSDKMGQNKKNKYIRIYRYKYIRNKGLKYKTLAKKRTKTDKMGRNRAGEHKMNIYLYV